MKNEKLRDCLDDALSGIGENPWLLRQVLSRAEQQEDKPVKKKLSLSMVLVVLLVLALMGAGVAAVIQWNVLDFLKEWGESASVDPVEVHRASETENARLTVESAVWDGETLAFDITLENRHPETPLWCVMESFTINGEAASPAINYEGMECGEIPGSLPAYSINGFENQWLPGWLHPDGVVRDGELIRIPEGDAGAESFHVEITAKVYRPNRPVTLLETADGFGEELDRMIAEGKYYVIPYDRQDEMPFDGFFVPEEGRDFCPEGWLIGVGGEPEDLMGGFTAETLEIRFDVSKSE